MRRKSQNIAFWQILRFWVLDIAGYSRLWYAWWSDHFAIKNFLVWWHDYLKLDIFCQEILKILIFDNLFDFDYMFDISDYYNEALEVEIVPLARCSWQLLPKRYGWKLPACNEGPELTARWKILIFGQKLDIDNTKRITGPDFW